MVSVNGNFENKGNYYFTKEIAKKEIAEEKVEKAKVEGKTEFKERGEELMSAEMYAAAVNMLAVNDKLDKEVADDLKEMFAMAGISHRLPTATEYARIANATKANIQQFVPFETEKHIESLFANSSMMDLLVEETQF